jgi:membrane protein DedA with SNARE-associated domain
MDGMDATQAFLVEHGYAVIFGVAVVNQLGLPLPCMPVLLGAGALAASGNLALGAVIAVAAVGSVAAHLAWYEAGRLAGTKVLRLVCRVALEPDACVRHTQDVYSRRGPKTLIIAHFVPGLVTVAQPLAGTLGMRRRDFLVYNVAGSLLWAGGFAVLGYLFSRQIAAILAIALGFGATLVGLVAGAVAIWIVWKLTIRRRILRTLRMARISVAELKRKLDAGEPVVVLDLRHEIELAVDQAMIPGALRIAPDEIEARHGEIPRGREVVLYCS